MVRLPESSLTDAQTADILYFLNAEKEIVARYPYTGTLNDKTWSPAYFYNDGNGRFYEVDGNSTFIRYSLNMLNK